MTPSTKENVSSTKQTCVVYSTDDVSPLGLGKGYLIPTDKTIQPKHTHTPHRPRVCTTFEYSHYLANNAVSKAVRASYSNASPRSSLTPAGRTNDYFAGLVAPESTRLGRDGGRAGGKAAER